MNKQVEALKLAEEALSNIVVARGYSAYEDEQALAAIGKALAEPVKQEPVARQFECWSTNDGDSWFEHPADAQLLYDVLGDDPKVGDEFEVSAGWNCVTATYRIASKDGDDFEVECISHPNNDAAPAQPVKQGPVGDMASAWFKKCCQLQDELNTVKQAPVSVEAAVLAEREACAKVCEKAMIQMNYSEAPYKQCAAAIRARGEK